MTCHMQFSPEGAVDIKLGRMSSLTASEGSSVWCLHNLSTGIHNYFGMVRLQINFLRVYFLFYFLFASV